MKFSQLTRKFPIALFVWAVLVGYPLAACADENKSGSKEKEVVVEAKGDRKDGKEDARITLDGGKDREFKDLDYRKLRVRSTGSAVAKFSGRVETLDIDVSGSGDIDAEGLQAETVDLDISGSGRVYVNASKEVNIWASGSCRIYVSGGATVNRKSISGNVRIYNKK